MFEVSWKWDGVWVPSNTAPPPLTEHHNVALLQLESIFTSISLISNLFLSSLFCTHKMKDVITSWQVRKHENFFQPSGIAQMRQCHWVPAHISVFSSFAELPKKTSANSSTHVTQLQPHYSVLNQITNKRKQKVLAGYYLKKTQHITYAAVCIIRRNMALKAVVSGIIWLSSFPLVNLLQGC